MHGLERLTLLIMSIISRIKDVFASQEMNELQNEVVETTKDVFDTVKEKAGDVKDMAADKMADVKEKMDEEDDDKIDFDTFLKTEVRVGTILSVEEVPKSDKLLKLMVNVGEDEPRQIISGIKFFFEDAQSLVDRQAMFVTNLAPRKIMGLESNGMIFAVNDKNGFSILEPDTVIEPGTRAS